MEWGQKEQVDRGPDQKANSLLHSVEAAGQREDLGVPGSRAWKECVSPFKSPWLPALLSWVPLIQRGPQKRAGFDLVPT